MNMIVCVKQVPDPEVPPAKFRIDAKTKQVMPPEGIPPVINPFDERALELALRLKDAYGGKITVLTMGSAKSESVVKRGISMGADDGFVLSDPSFQDSDSFGTAHILAAAIQKIGNYDLILCGRQASDWDEGVVGSIIAENLSLPFIALALAIEAADKALKVKACDHGRLPGVFRTGAGDGDGLLGCRPPEAALRQRSDHGCEKENTCLERCRYRS